MRNELGLVAIPIQRTIDQQAEIFIAQFALLGHLREQVVVNLARTVTGLGEDARFLSRLGMIVKEVVVALGALEAF